MDEFFVAVLDFFFVSKLAVLPVVVLFFDRILLFLFLLNENVTRLVTFVALFNVHIEYLIESLLDE